jgi:hypothetical protein
MSLTNPHLGPRPAQALGVPRGRLGHSEGSRRSRARRGPRGGEIGNAVYSTGPLLLFLLATYVVVGAVALLALHPTVWMLLVAVAIHVAATAFVFGVVVALLDE